MDHRSMYGEYFEENFGVAFILKNTWNVSMELQSVRVEERLTLPTLVPQLQFYVRESLVSYVSFIYCCLFLISSTFGAVGSTVEPRYLELAYFELPLISKWKSGPCFNMKIWQQVTK